MGCAKNNEGVIDECKGSATIKYLPGDSTPPFSTTLDPFLPPTQYQVLHSSEVVSAGMPSHLDVRQRLEQQPQVGDASVVVPRSARHGGNAATAEQISPRRGSRVR
jgi:hypothetical protein